MRSGNHYVTRVEPADPLAPIALGAVEDAVVFPTKTIAMRKTKGLLLPHHAERRVEKGEDVA